MNDTQTPQPDYDAIAHQAYEWLKKRRAKGEVKGNHHIHISRKPGKSR